LNQIKTACLETKFLTLRRSCTNCTAVVGLENAHGNGSDGFAETIFPCSLFVLLFVWLTVVDCVMI